MRDGGGTASTLQQPNQNTAGFPVGEEAGNLVTDPMGFGQAEKKPTAFLASAGITFAKYNGFSQKSPNFTDGTHSA